MNDLVLDEQTRSNKNVAMVCYALYALSALVGITAIAAIIINYVKRDDVRGTWLESHFRWQIRTFWFGLLWAVIGMILAIIAIGFVVLFAVSVWLIYRVVKGWLYLNDNRPMYPAPA